ncbi:AIPR family protein [Nocardioides lijunqiniae]|uniref:AIPR family protein n=1 Tax=Nocardioides lijunqiniae TaxID=2760832 RepID=UPI001878F8BC|nr:AIPR family protein [Nocardioides lijunqiniae]
MTEAPAQLWRQQLDEIAVVDGESDERTQMLLWLLRSVYDQEELDSYEGVFARRLRVQTRAGAVWIDGLAHHPRGDVMEHVVLVWIDEGDLREQQFAGAVALASLAEHEPQLLESAILNTDAATRLQNDLLRARSDARNFTWRVAAVSPVAWDDDQGPEGARLEPWDANRMAGIAAAQRAPGLLREVLTVDVPESQRLATKSGSRKVFVAPVSGREIAEWPGIDSRRLFDLNVRFSLGGTSRVRQSLDGAFAERNQEDFIAFHNGLTVICHEVRESPSSLDIVDVSVVNGAQSVIALRANRHKITEDLRVLVKFVEVGDDDQLARQIAVRSNTQNPVSGRNLRALDESQVRFAQELAVRGYVLDTRPDTSRVPVEKTIRNDDAAQWICAVYLERPWLAVKRTSLFNPEIFQDIFGPDRTPEQIILLNTLRGVVNSFREQFPPSMRRAWLLTALTCMYLCGQLLRFDDDHNRVLLHPEVFEGDADVTVASLIPVAQFVVNFLNERHERSRESSEEDDFRVQFKRQRTLLEMSAEIKKKWRLEKRDRRA